MSKIAIFVFRAMIAVSRIWFVAGGLIGGFLFAIDVLSDSLFRTAMITWLAGSSPFLVVFIATLGLEFFTALALHRELKDKPIPRIFAQNGAYLWVLWCPELKQTIFQHFSRDVFFYNASCGELAWSPGERGWVIRADSNSYDDRQATRCPWCERIRVRAVYDNDGIQKKLRELGYVKITLDDLKSQVENWWDYGHAMFFRPQNVLSIDV